ncbi:MAG: P-II family nitrogen regulator [Bacilli bacterium]
MKKETKKEEIITEENEYECLVVIINSGYSDIVMDAARKEGAKGGTILHARGTATKELTSKFDITISPDKELILILVHQSIRDNVLLAINTAAGLGTDCQGIAFSLPVSDVAGIKKDSE